MGGVDAGFCCGRDVSEGESGLEREEGEEACGWGGGGVGRVVQGDGG